MSVFEALMLVCFGAAWPFSIYRSWKSRQNGGKSVAFLFVVFAGYVFGTLHKVLHSMDFVILLYVANGIMVATDIALFYRNSALARARA
jgi:hypothetical protein